MEEGLTTQELIKKYVKKISVTSLSLGKYIESGNKLLDAADMYREVEDEEGLFIRLMRLDSLVLDTIPKHKDYKNPRYADDVRKLRLRFVGLIDEMEDLKESINRRAEIKKIEEKQKKLKKKLESSRDSSGAESLESLGPPPDSSALQGLESLNIGNYATSDPSMGMDLLTGAPTATGIPATVNNQSWPKTLPTFTGSEQKEEEQEEESDENLDLTTLYPQVDSTIPSIPDKPFQLPKESEAQVPSNNNHAYAPTQEATPAFQPLASAPQLPTPALDSHSTGYDNQIINQPEPYSNPNNSSVAASNFQAPSQPMNDQYEFTISNGFPPQGHVASPTSGQQLDPVYRDNYMEKQRRLQEENYRRAQAQALAAKQETQRQLEQERQRQLEQERQRQFEQERQRQLEQEGIMRENARLEEQRKLHAKAIEDARALEAKRQALVAEEERKRERERARRNYEDSKYRNSAGTNQPQGGRRTRKHIPNTIQSIPKPEEAKLDHAKLDERIKAYGMSEKKVLGDGNCQFRALSDQVSGTPDNYERVRYDVITQLQKYPDEYSCYVPDNYRSYLSKMSKDGEWGDHVTLKAAADFYGTKINVMSSYPGDQFIIKIEPMKRTKQRILWLSFWAEVHYNSLYSNG